MLDKIYKPIIAITQGDPLGIGPEIICKALAKEDVYKECRPVVVADLKAIEEGLRITNLPLKINKITSIEEAKFSYGVIDVFDLNNFDYNGKEYGTIDKEAGKSAGESIEKVIQLAMQGHVDATVTAPIHKESFKLAGYGEKYAGHTEMYADLTNTKKYSMLLAHGNLRTVHVTTHVSMRQAIELIKKERVYDSIKLAHDGCVLMGIEKPKIVVAGLNPHAGEHGLFGSEEIDEIIPAVEQAKSEGYDVEGPLPADTLYSKVQGGWYDIAVSMYHDQGHIPLKLAGFNWIEKEKKWSSIAGVNITLGLPIIRVSVDHGTAFGKAGKGTANEESLLNAIEYAIKFATTKHKKK